MAKSQMDFTLSPEQVAGIVLAHVLASMIDRTRCDAKVRLESNCAMVTVTRKRAPRKAKAAA